MTTIEQPAQSSETEHVVQFYENDGYLINSVSDFLGTGLVTEDGCIMIATAPHLARIEQRLQALGLDLWAVRARNAYVAQDADETLARFMIEGNPDPERFQQIVGELIARVSVQGQRRVRIFGEMVQQLWRQGNCDAAIRLEALWNELRAVSPPFTLFCAYAMQGFAGAAHHEQFQTICQQHTSVIPIESYTELESDDERARAITLLQQKALSLEAEIAERKAVEERLHAFISMASHELRTPVTSLKGFTQILQRRLKSQVDPQTLRFLDRMDTQLNRLSHLITDLLDVPRMEAGTLVYRESWFDFDALVRETVENVQAGTSTHRIVLEGESCARLYGDQERLGQVIINLLTNAIKYSPEANSVLVRLYGDGAQVEVAVQDFGIGIDEAHHQRIFERFYQVCETAESTYPGLGIGLYIAKTIVMRHGGTLCVESRKGEGSTFRVTLPLRSIPPQATGVEVG